jgi:hypothetical protein
MSVMMRAIEIANRQSAKPVALPFPQGSHSLG